MDLEWCRRLKVDPEKNINDLGCKFGLKLFRILDGNPKTCDWEILLVTASELNSFYNVSLTDVRVIANSSGSPSKKVLYLLGSRGMKAYELVFILDKMKLEVVLMDIKLYEPIIILKQPPPSKTVRERTVLMLKVKGIGFPYPRYQWFKSTNGTYEKLRGETNKTLQIKNASQSDSGVYCCRLLNGNKRSNVEFSNKTHVFVTLSPVTQPANVNLHPVNEQISKYPHERPGEQHTDDTSTAATPCRIPKENLEILNTETTYAGLHPVSEQSWEKSQDQQGEQHGEDNSNVILQDTLSQGNQEYCVKAKVALMIGNSDYLAHSPLYGAPKADLQLLSSTFMDLGFKVFSLLNLTKSEMKTMLQRFIQYIRAIGKDVYVVFCFFGHGFENSGKIYLVPTDASHGSGTEECICADHILSQLQQQVDPPLIVMALDTCRIKNNNPSNRGRTMCQLDSLNGPTRAGNTVVLYSTSKGLSAYQDRTNGFLAKYLNEQIKRQSSVIDVVTAVQRDMKKEFEKRREDQIPEFRSNLWEPQRSFKDKVYTDTVKAMPCPDIFEPPCPVEVEVSSLGVRLQIEFQVETLNIMNMFVKILHATWLDGTVIDIGDLKLSVDNCLNHPTIERAQPVNNIEKFVVKDLQKLQCDLIVKVYIWNIKTNFSNGVEMNLGKPLISALDIWRNSF